MAAVEGGDGEALPPALLHESGGRSFLWGLSEGRSSRCASCCCDEAWYEADDEGADFAFCPACWTIRGEEPGGGSFHVGASLEKKVRDLPPGMTMALLTEAAEAGDADARAFLDSIG